MAGELAQAGIKRVVYLEKGFAGWSRPEAVTPVRLRRVTTSEPYELFQRTAPLHLSSLFISLLRVALGAVFIVASLDKIQNHEAFATTIANYRFCPIPSSTHGDRVALARDRHRNRAGPRGLDQGEHDHCLGLAVRFLRSHKPGALSRPGHQLWLF